MQIDKTFDFQKRETEIYSSWEAQKCFAPNDSSDTFTVIMPPPNATGQLHMGHACGLSIQDTMIRFKRMQGYSALYVPGTDHAALATSSKVESLYFQKEGKTRYDYGRDKFLELVDEFVKTSQNTIIQQTKVMGTSCDWNNLRYTLEPKISEQVLKTFVRMYNDGLIYRAGRIVNWDPNMQTTVSEDEIKYVEEKTKFYYFKFGPVTIGTSRPETKFKDKIIVVHPDDERYKDIIGKEFECEWIDGTIKARVIADDCIDMQLGTGAMTITPAHSLIDFELSQRHNLEVEKIIDKHGNIINSVSKSCGGLHISDARKKVVEILDAKGLLEKVEENYIHNVATNDRGGGIIEPQVMSQWWLDVNKEVIEFQGQTLSFKQILQKVIHEKQIEIIPKRFESVYFNWVDNFRDWCLSRQIWFGHRVPAWFKGNEIKVQIDSPGEGWEQDSDCLDTWFSSAMWTFTSLGYPDSDLLKKYHPTDVMETGWDILPIWVIRMIMLSTYTLGEIPFRQVFLHGMVVDKFGKKMSKSKGNGIDPLDVVAKYGADAVRLSLLIGLTPGQDTRMYEEKIASYRNFVTKVWNSVRFVFMNVEAKDLKTNSISTEDLITAADNWIICELNKLITDTTESMENWRLSEAGSKLYDFLWNTLCSWYIEMSKTQPNPKVLVYVTKTVLKMLQPFMPFATQELWEQFGNKNQLMLESWPTPTSTHCEQSTAFNQDIIETIQVIRSLKQEMGVENNRETCIKILTPKELQSAESIISKMSKTNNIRFENSQDFQQKGFIGSIVKKDIYILLEISDNIDIAAEITKCDKEIANTQKQIANCEGRLNNPKYVNSAPEHLVQDTRDTLEQHKDNLEKLNKKLIHLKNV